MEVNPKLARVATFLGWERKWNNPKQEFRWYAPKELGGDNYLAPHDYLADMKTLAKELAKQDNDFQIAFTYAFCFMEGFTGKPASLFSMDEWADCFLMTADSKKVVVSS